MKRSRFCTLSVLIFLTLFAALCFFGCGKGGASPDEVTTAEPAETVVMPAEYAFTLKEEYAERAVKVSKEDFEKYEELQLWGYMSSAPRCEAEVLEIINTNEPIKLFDNDTPITAEDEQGDGEYEKFTAEGEYVSIITDGDEYAFVYSEKITADDEDEDSFAITGYAYFETMYDGDEIEELIDGDDYKDAVEYKPLICSYEIGNIDISKKNFIVLTDKGPYLFTYKIVYTKNDDSATSRSSYEITDISKHENKYLEALLTFFEKTEVGSN